MPFAENNTTGRKLSDEDIHKLAQTEGGVTLITLREAEKYVKQQSYQQKKISLSGSLGKKRIEKFAFQNSSCY